MPEPYWPKRKGGYYLSDAKANGMLIRIACTYDKHERWYEPADLKKAYGDDWCASGMSDITNGGMSRRVER